jgi:2-haloacid dehalogenase
VKPRAVIFDIGQVLIGWEPEAFYDARIGADRRREMFARADLAEMNLAIDRGAAFRETVYARAAANPDFADEIRLWHDRWSDFVTGPIAGSVAILRELRAAGVPVHALSNFGLGPFAIAADRFSFLSEFDRRYLSGAMGMVKPEPEIYRAVEADLGIAPEALFFIDDRSENVIAARARGWQGHVFDGPQGLADALRSAGLSVWWTA